MSRNLSDNPLPNQIREQREFRHLSMREVADMMGLKSTSPISEWEKGVLLPSLRNAFKLSAAIHVPLESLFFDLLQEVRAEMSERRQRYLNHYKS